LPPVPFLPERLVFWRLCPASRRNPGRDASCPTFTARRSDASAVLGVVILSVRLSLGKIITLHRDLSSLI